MDIVCVTFDCREPGKVAEFWNEALGWGGVAVSPDGTGAICGPPSGGVYLEFVTVPETIIARQAGMRVLAFSLMTNMAAGLSDEKISHQHTLEQAGRVKATASALLAQVIEEVAK